MLVEHFAEVLGSLYPYVKTPLATVATEGLNGPTMQAHVPAAVLVGRGGGRDYEGG